MQASDVHRCVVALTVAVLLGATWTAAAGHRARVTAHCTYEIGELEPNAGFTIDYAIEDPVGVTADGAINDTVCAFHTPATDPGEGSQLGPAHFFLSGVLTIDGQYGSAQASIVDDAFGNHIGGAMCGDFNHDHLCGDPDEGEPASSFCGTSEVVSVGQDTDGDGHSDFGWGLVVGVNGYVQQVLNCDPTQAPTSTSGGVLNPNGGIFVTVSG